VVFRLTLPHPKSKDSTSDIILSILILNPEISAKKVHNLIKKHYGKSITYRATHKNLTRLMRDDVLIKRNLEYSVNPQWLRDVKEYLELAEQKDMIRGAKIVQNNENIQIITFNTIRNVDYYVMDLETNTNKPPVALNNHFWWAFVYPEKLVAYFHNNHTKIYGLCKGATFLDKHCVTIEKQIGFISESLPELQIVTDTYIQDNMVIQVFYPNKFVKEIDYLYRSCNSIAQLDLTKIVTLVFKTDQAATLVIEKNSVKADNLRRYAIELLKQKLGSHN
jgi:hypothetical protein